MDEYSSPINVVERDRKRRSDDRRKETETSRYESVPDISCSHGITSEIRKHKRSNCDAAQLTFNDFNSFRSKFLVNKTKIDQDNFILKCVNVTEPARRTTEEGRKHKFRSISITYHIQNENGEDIVVCSDTFLSVLDVSRSRVQRLARNYSYLLTGEMPFEKRGGRRLRERDEEQTDSIKRDILKYRCREAHYSRRDTGRCYLPPELNIKKMWQRYGDKNVSSGNVRCSLSKYKSVFYKYFNLGFGNPRSDTCSTCAELLVQIKNEHDLERKNGFRTEYRCHKMRAKEFFNQMRRLKEGTITICFDCQQNQPFQSYL